MRLTEPTTLEASFNQLVEMLLQACRPEEQFTLELIGEHSQFIRFNHARVRQTGLVADATCSLTLMHDQRISFREFPCTGDVQSDLQQAQIALEDLRQEVPQLPVDPYLVLPEGNHQSREVHSGRLLEPEQVVPSLLPVVADLDFTGAYAGGFLIRAYADSQGQKHWFATESFTLDYSLFIETGQAVKATLAGSHWDAEAYEQQIQTAKAQLKQLAQPAKPISRGQYRTYLAPAAIAELVSMLSWGGVSEAALQQGGSALGPLQRQEKQLSSAFTLKENFQRGLVPRFNEQGEIAPLELPVIERGKLVNTLVNSRTAKEYQKVANGASASESLRTPEISPGQLSRDRLLSALDTGLYVSNLHYLNWSDRPSGRITGMTRYACFWVEQGEIVAPIENLRFDESLYRCWGENLIDLTDFQEFIPNVDTYEHRGLGGTWVPGMLIADFTYTL